MKTISTLFLALLTTTTILHSASALSSSQSSPSSSSSSSNTPPRYNDVFCSTQATWEDVGRNLLQLRSCGVPDEILMTTRLHIPNLCRTYVAPSTVPGAGRGLFAAMPAKKGDLLTCYPGDVLLQPTGMTNVPDRLKQDDELLRSLLTRYCIGVRDDGQYAIMGLPDLDDDMAYAGHLINDGAKPPLKESELQRYISESNKLVNVEHAPLENIHMVTVATRDIEKDEELFVFYGPTYWMDHKATWIGGEDGGGSNEPPSPMLTP